MIRRGFFRARDPPQLDLDHEDRRLRPLIIAAIASPLPPGAARRLAYQALAACQRPGQPLTREQRELLAALEASDGVAAQR